MDDEPRTPGVTGREPARIPRIDPAHVVDVFVYVVVLNLAAQYAPKVITETFTTSLAVAVLLKVVLEGVLAVLGGFYLVTGLILALLPARPRGPAAARNQRRACGDHRGPAFRASHAERVAARSCAESPT